MARAARRMSFTERAELWRRWENGQSLSEIGRALERSPGRIHCLVAEHGGFPPPPRKRNPRQLTGSEREEISRGLSAGLSLRQIASQVGRPPSTISREVRRNGGRAGYRASNAELNAWKRARRPKPCKLAQNGKLKRLVAAKLQLNWAPEQIAGWLQKRYPDEVRMHLSHETIYKSLFIQARSVLKSELRLHLRTQRRLRRSNKSSTAGQGRGQIVDAISISERPPEAADRAIPGHWEGDLITGSNNTHIATLVERRSRFVVLVKVDGKDTVSVTSALIREVRKLPAHLKRTLTWDRGPELAAHKKFSIATDVDVYFCDPQSPWQRGTNENTNGLLRQYFPKGTDLSQHSQAELNRVAKQLNQRPRKTLGFDTPADTFHATLQ